MSDQFVTATERSLMLTALRQLLNLNQGQGCSHGSGWHGVLTCQVEDALVTLCPPLAP